MAANRGATDVEVTSVDIEGFDPSTGSGQAPSTGSGQGPASACAASTVKKDAVFTCTADARVPRTARPTTPYFSDVYWQNPSAPAINTFDPRVPFGLPFAPSPFRVTFRAKAGSVEVT